MLDLIIQKTDFTPSLICTLETKTLTIEGKSLPEDARSFYKPILKWLEDLESKNIDTIELDINLSYFNSSSSKQLLKMFYALEDLAEKGTKSTVVWKYESNDLMIKEKGEEFSELIELPFSFIEF